MSTLSFEGRNSTLLFSYTINPQPTLPVHDVIHTSRSHFLSEILFWHLWMTHPPRARVNTCAHVCTHALSRKVFIRTKAKGKIYNTKSLGNNITIGKNKDSVPSPTSRHVFLQCGRYFRSLSEESSHCLQPLECLRRMKKKKKKKKKTSRKQEMVLLVRELTANTHWNTRAEGSAIIHQLCVDSGCRFEDLLRRQRRMKMKREREKIKGLSVISYIWC